MFGVMSWIKGLQGDTDELLEGAGSSRERNVEVVVLDVSCTRGVIRDEVVGGSSCSSCSSFWSEANDSGTEGVLLLSVSPAIGRSSELVPLSSSTISGELGGLVVVETSGGVELPVLPLTTLLLPEWFSISTMRGGLHVWVVVCLGEHSTIRGECCSGV